MAGPTVTGLRSVDLGVPDIGAQVAFYRDVWALEPVAERRGSVYLRATGGVHHVLALHPRPRVELLRVTLSARSAADVEALRSSAGSAGATRVEPGAPAGEPGGGYGFTFADPEGRIVRVLAEDARHRDTADAPDRPRRLAHVVLNSADAEGAAAFYGDALGFRLSDRTRTMHFLRCSQDHHSLAFARGTAATLNHVAFEMPDLESVMRGAGRLRDHGHPIEWGVGRHGPGNNVFAYFVGPGDVVVEYTAEVQQVDDSYRVGAPGDWTWPPGRTDRWGISGPPSERLQAAQRKVRFAADIFHPGD
jgi:catechol 2,3-dioxygenase